MNQDRKPQEPKHPSASQAEHPSPDVFPSSSARSLESLSEDLRIHQEELERRERELRETQGILERSRERYFALFDLSPVAYFVIDRAHRIQEVNLAASSLLGLSRPEVRGQAFHRFLHAEAWPLFSAHLQDALSEQGRRVVDMHLQCGDGRLLPVHLQSQWMQGSDDSSELCLVSCVDLTPIRAAETAIRQSEERYRQLVEWIPDAVMVLVGGRVEYANPAARAMMAGESSSTLTGVEWSQILRDKETRIPNAFTQASEPASEVSPARELLVHRLDHSTFSAEVAFVPIEYHQQLAVLVILRDVTQRKNAEQQRLAMERRLLEAIRLESLGVIAAGVAHDFNNQLTDVMGNVVLARRALESRGNPIPSLLRAEAAASRMADVCRKLVVAAGISRTQRERIDLHEVVAECMPLLQLSLHSHVQLAWLESPGPCWIKGDAGQIRQLILNVVQNAIEAIGTHSGHIQLLIKPYPLDSHTHSFPALPPGLYSALQICDDGPGIAPDILSRIFDPFFSTKFIGRGLGLSAVLGIMKNHAGGVLVQSSEKGGAQFTFLFPREDPTPKPTPPNNDPDSSSLSLPA